MNQYQENGAFLPVIVNRFDVNGVGLRKRCARTHKNTGVNVQDTTEGSRQIFREIGKTLRDPKLKRMLDMRLPLKMRVTTFSKDRTCATVPARKKYVLYGPYQIDMMFVMMWKILNGDKGLRLTKLVQAVEWQKCNSPQTGAMIEIGPLMDETSTENRLTNDTIEDLLKT